MRFEFDIEPVEQARPRATRMRKEIRVYDPKKVAVFKRNLGMLAKQQMQDLDNYIKSTSDALNGIIWADDNLIVSLEAKKYYAERPHLTVEIKEEAEK